MTDPADFQFRSLKDDRQLELAVPPENQNLGGKRMTKVPVEVLLRALGTGEQPRELRRLLSADGDVLENLHPKVSKQIKKWLKDAGLVLKSEGEFPRVLLIAAAPYCWRVREEGGGLFARGPRPSACRDLLPRPAPTAALGRDPIAPIRLFDGKAMQGVAGIFWRHDLSLAHCALSAMATGEQELFFQYVAETDGLDGLKRMATATDGEYPHAFVWRAILKLAWKWPKYVRALADVCLQADDPWTRGQSQVLRPMIEQVLRRLATRMRQHSIHDPNYGTRRRTDTMFPLFTAATLPQPSSLFEQLPRDILANILALLGPQDWSALLGLNRRCNAIFGGAACTDLTLWQGMLYRRYPEIATLRLTPKECLDMMAFERTIDWLREGEWDPTDANQVALHGGWSQLALRAMAMRAGGDVASLIGERVRERSPGFGALAYEGAMLPPAQRRQWWHVVGRTIELESRHPPAPSELREATDRIGLLDAVVLVGGIHTRAEFGTVPRSGFASFPVNDRNAGLFVALYPLMDASSDRGRAVRRTIEQWFFEQAVQGDIPTRAMLSILDCLCHLGNLGPRRGDGWYDMLDDVLSRPNIPEAVEDHVADWMLKARRLQSKVIREVAPYPAAAAAAAAAAPQLTDVNIPKLTPLRRPIPRPDDAVAIAPGIGGFPARQLAESTVLVVEGKHLGQLLDDLSSAKLGAHQLIVTLEPDFDGWDHLTAFRKQFGEIEVVLESDRRPNGMPAGAARAYQFVGWRPGATPATRDPFAAQWGAPYIGPGCFAPLAHLPTETEVTQDHLDRFSSYLLLLTDRWQQVPKFRYVRSLDLSHNRLVSDALLRPLLERFPYVRRLILRDCPYITDAGVQALTSNLPHRLKHLDLSDNPQLEQRVEAACTVITDRCATPDTTGDFVLIAGRERFSMDGDALRKLVDPSLASPLNLEMECGRPTLEAFASYAVAGHFSGGALTIDELMQLHILAKRFGIGHISKLCADHLQTRLMPVNVARIYQFATEEKLAALVQSTQMFDALFTQSIAAPLDPYSEEFADFEIEGPIGRVQARVLESEVPRFRELLHPYDDGYYPTGSMRLDDYPEAAAAAVIGDAISGATTVDRLGLEEQVQAMNLAGEDQLGRPDIAHRAAQGVATILVGALEPASPLAPVVDRALHTFSPVILRRVSLKLANILQQEARKRDEQLSVSADDLIALCEHAGNLQDAEDRLDNSWQEILRDALILLVRVLLHRADDPAMAFSHLHRAGVFSHIDAVHAADQHLYMRFYGAGLPDNWRAVLRTEMGGEFLQLRLL